MKNRKEKAIVSRRDFFSGSVAVTLAAIVPTQDLSASAEEDGDERRDSEAPEIVFRSARPIWPRGRDKEMNLFVGFRVAFKANRRKSVSLRMAGASIYRVFLNGKLFAWGPARGPHGHYRVDDWEITSSLVRGENLLCVEVAGYNVNSYYTLNQSSFLQAEVTADSEVLASTGGKGRLFEASILQERVQKVQRYTFERAFSEVYRLHAESHHWRDLPDASFAAVPCEMSAARELIPRRVPFPDYAKRQPEEIAAEGSFDWSGVAPASLAVDRSIPGAAKIGPTLLGFTEPELTAIPYLELQKTKSRVNTQIDSPYVWDQFLPLKSGEFKILDFGTNLAGFFGAHVKVHTPAKLYFTFDETLIDGDVDFKRLMCVNIVAYTLDPGTYDLENIEPYTLRFLKLMVLEGQCEVSQVFLREYTAPDVYGAHFRSSDEGLNQLFAAGRETYRSNAVDFFTDCPSRERAGYLCDSSFTAQVAPLLCGHTAVERCFFENFLLPDHFEHMPAGMLPMCYPADHYDGTFIPNWALWFVIQLEAYLERSGDVGLVEALRPRVLRLFDYFAKFQNEDGLLEKLQGWVFVEWSKSNDYVQDVNYPTNMLYASALATIGRIYNLPKRTEEAQAIRKAIVAQSYDGEFFVDNALRKNGKVIPTRNRTETCQYYAFYFETATVELYPRLWETLHTAFGPRRRETKAYPEIAPSNAFTGNTLRLELLSRVGLTDQLMREARDYLLYMAELTGTLWENTSDEASMDHAFESHIVTILYRDILGLYHVDTVRKVVNVRFTPSALQVCEGRVPTPDGFVFMRWTRDANVLTYQLDVPAGYAVEVANAGNVEIRRKQFPRGKVDYGYKVEGGYK